MATLTHRRNPVFITIHWSWRDFRTYAFAVAFAAVNLLLPYIAHLSPGGGLRFLPIYFFVLIAGYKFGPKVGLLTALASPLANNMIAGMPPLPILYFVLIKSIALALIASLIAMRSQKLSFLTIAATVVAYQLIGSVVIYAFTQNVAMTWSDFTFGYPGLLTQLVGGYLVLYLLRNYGKENV